MERRFLPTESCPVEVLKRENGSPMIAGYGAVFYVEDDAGTEYQLFPELKERIMPRAFNRALQDKHNAAALFNHDPNLVLGRVASGTLKLKKDMRGLRYEIDPPASRQDVVESIRRGDVTGSSFGFRVLEQKFRTEKNAEGQPIDVREIHSVELLDVSPVVFPAYTGTSTGIRSESDGKEARAAYDAWKKQANGEAEREAALAAKLAGYASRAQEVGE